jgi:hypothetical protein
MYIPRLSRAARHALISRPGGWAFGVANGVPEIVGHELYSRGIVDDTYEVTVYGIQVLFALLEESC